MMYNFELANEPIKLEFISPTFMIVIGADYYLSVGASFTIISETGRISIDPEGDISKEMSAEISRFCSSHVVRIEILDDKTLRIATAEGVTFEVKPDSDYEAWDLNGPKRLKLVCMPGGELAIWDAQE